MFTECHLQRVRPSYRIFLLMVFQGNCLWGRTGHKIKSRIVVIFTRLHKCKAQAKRSQQANTTRRNIVGCNMLLAFGHRVAMRCNMLGIVASSLKLVKFESTTPNMSQHITTRWPNARNMLRYVVLACCDRLAGA